MIDPDLVRQLADPGRRTAARRGARDFATWWRRHPAVAALHDRLEPIGGGGTGADAIEAARPLLAGTGWVRDGLAALARAAIDDPLFEPPLRSIEDATQRGLILIDHPLLQIALTRLAAATFAAEGGAATVGFIARHCLCRFVIADGAALDLWEASPADDGFVAARAGRCRRTGRLELADGALLAQDGAREAWTIARMPADIVLLQATARTGGAPLAIDYAADDGRFLAAHSADGAVARMQLLATMLRRMGRRDALPVLAAIAREETFGLRWHATREMAALDRQAALPLVRAMAQTDPHPEIRAAAARTLALLAA